MAGYPQAWRDDMSGLEMKSNKLRAVCPLTAKRLLPHLCGVSLDDFSPKPWVCEDEVAAIVASVWGFVRVSYHVGGKDTKLNTRCPASTALR